jgi:hypothetical protein
MAKLLIYNELTGKRPKSICIVLAYTGKRYMAWEKELHEIIIQLYQDVRYCIRVEVIFGMVLAITRSKKLVQITRRMS